MFCQFACGTSLFLLLSAIAPKMQVSSRAIERFQRAMRPALLIILLVEPPHPSNGASLSVFQNTESAPFSCLNFQKVNKHLRIYQRNRNYIRIEFYGEETRANRVPIHERRKNRVRKSHATLPLTFIRLGYNPHKQTFSESVLPSCFAAIS